MRKAIVFLVGMLVLLPVAGAAPSRTARLTITDLSPLTVRGSGFAGLERVRVSVIARQGSTRQVVANPRGSFTLRLRAVVLVDCRSYVVRAVGQGGSAVTKKVAGECLQRQDPRDDPRASYPLYPNQP